MTGKQTLHRLQAYKKKHKLTDYALAKKLGVYGIYPHRWRKAGRIIGIYQRFVEDFLKKEEGDGRF